MNVTELLQFVDQVVQKQTGEHLDDLEKAILKGLWQGQTYNQIADESGYNSQNYIGDVSRKLFKTLSEQLGEDINKYNFCWTLERVINSPQFVGLINTKINWCPNYPKPDKNQSHEEKSTSQLFYHDLTIAPKITHFYGRETELQTLSHWLINQNTRLISILGLPGIEKSWSTLINLYEGNPAYLQDISSLIRNIFQGKISDFLSEGLLLTENMKYQLSELFNRLSTVEQQIVLEMSKSNQPVNREQLRESLSLSSMELINGLQSLKRRYLVTTIESDKTLFILSPVFREYVIITP
ncbi:MULTISPECIES: hypothetical protein [unclassified Anabaena]|jgi:hypothetical protein|uniref:hypothetical protein n=1 Tax=unclassified Anabaena TaxID=2619674 RepID=UPI0006AC167E|nr:MULTISPECIES: hypothetical protein [unclassified Anabaena]ALB42187.1 hypothetical protein AA650_18550 [Anabaena sp. WA102]OBQ22265.1 MAG: hypothetical protein AN486_02455 [Anabaena sp. AL93]